MHTTHNIVKWSRISLNIALLLINVDLSMFDAHVTEDEYNIFSKLLIYLRISDFENDDECEMWTRFKISELLDLIKKLELPEYIIVPRNSSKFYCFNCKELLIYLLIRLPYRLSHTVMVDMIFYRDLA